MHTDNLGAAIRFIAQDGVPEDSIDLWDRIRRAQPRRTAAARPRWVAIAVPALIGLALIVILTWILNRPGGQVPVVVASTPTATEAATRQAEATATRLPTLTPLPPTATSTPVLTGVLDPATLVAQVEAVSEQRMSDLATLGGWLHRTVRREALLPAMAGYRPDGSLNPALTEQEEWLQVTSRRAVIARAIIKRDAQSAEVERSLEYGGLSTNLEPAGPLYAPGELDESNAYRGLDPYIAMVALPGSPSVEESPGYPRHAEVVGPTRSEAGEVTYQLLIVTEVLTPENVDGIDGMVVQSLERATYTDDGRLRAAEWLYVTSDGVEHTTYRLTTTPWEPSAGIPSDLSTAFLDAFPLASITALPDDPQAVAFIKVVQARLDQTWQDLISGGGWVRSRARFGSPIVPGETPSPDLASLTSHIQESWMHFDNEGRLIESVDYLYDGNGTQIQVGVFKDGVMTNSVVGQIPTSGPAVGQGQPVRLLDSMYEQLDRRLRWPSDRSILSIRESRADEPGDVVIVQRTDGDALATDSGFQDSYPGAVAQESRAYYTADGVRVRTEMAVVYADGHEALVNWMDSEERTRLDTLPPDVLALLQR